jgi:hypothetical protein
MLCAMLQIFYRKRNLYFDRGREQALQMSRKFQCAIHCLQVGNVTDPLGTHPTFLLANSH